MLTDCSLWLLRHGTSDGKSDSNTPAQDFVRTLTPKGAKQSIRAGQLLAEIAAPFDAIYTSPVVRCVQSAQLACASFGPEVRPVRKAQLNETPERHPNVAVALAVDGKAVLLVGHGPEWESVIKHTTGRDVFPSRGTIAQIHIVNGQGTLQTLLTPKDIAGMV